MDKQIGQIRWIETDDGYRIEISGVKLKEMLSSCSCLPLMSCCCGSRKDDDCCKPKKE